MNRAINLTLLVVMMVIASGCYTTGLSMRERGSFNYSNFVYGLYEDDAQDTTKVSPMRTPIKLAVAQVGENAPPKDMLNRLAEERYLISELAIIPAGGNETNYYGNQKREDPEKFAKRMKNMRKLAKDLGSDYIFMFGGSADYGSTPNWLQVFDLTLIGAYIIPSTKIKAEGRAAGALIDVKTGKVIFMVNAESIKQLRLPTGIAYNKQSDVVVALRDELVSIITDNFIKKLTVKKDRLL